jgi:hypothetical protein
MSESSSEDQIVYAGKRIGMGGEHSVHADDLDPGSVVKWLHWFGRLWQSHGAELVDADLEVLEECKYIEAIPTEVLHDPVVVTRSWLGENYSRRPYVMRQPFLEQSVVRLSHLKEDPELAQRVCHWIHDAEVLLQEHDAGVDFLGTAALVDLARVAVSGEVDVALHNLLYKDAEDRSAGLLLGDIRLWRYEKFPWLLQGVLREWSEFQYEILTRFSQDIDPSVEHVSKAKTPLPSRLAEVIYGFLKNRGLAFNKTS